MNLLCLPLLAVRGSVHACICARPFVIVTLDGTVLSKVTVRSLHVVDVRWAIASRWEFAEFVNNSWLLLFLERSHSGARVVCVWEFVSCAHVIVPVGWWFEML